MFALGLNTMHLSTCAVWWAPSVSFNKLLFRWAVFIIHQHGSGWWSCWLNIWCDISAALTPVISSHHTPPHQSQRHTKGGEGRWIRSGKESIFWYSIIITTHACRLIYSVCCICSFCWTNTEKVGWHREIRTVIQLSKPPNQNSTLGLTFLATNLYHQPSSSTSLIGKEPVPKNVTKRRKKKRKRNEAATHFSQ